MTREEAINEVKGWDFLNDRETEAIQTLIPELAEKSGDEKIREELIKLLNILSDGIVENYTTVPLKDFVAYLEKQKDIESKYAGMVVVSQEEFDNAIAIALELGMNEGERQKEQKPADNVSREEYVKRFKILCDAYEIKLPNREYDIYHLCDDLAKLSIDSSKQKPAEWSEEDEKMVRFYEADYNNQIDDMSMKDVINMRLEFKNWLVNRLKYLRLYPKQEWSEEDETAYGDLIWCIEQAKKSAKDENDMGNIWFAENWIKNRIKYLRPQPKHEWSEEEKARIDRIVDILDWAEVKGRISYSDWRDYVCYVRSLKPQQKQGLSEDDKKLLDFWLDVIDRNDWRMDENFCKALREFINRLKSLRTKPSWKPSEEQMETLKDVINRALLTCRQQGPLESLYSDLKKLTVVQ